MPFLDLLVKYTQAAKREQLLISQLQLEKYPKEFDHIDQNLRYCQDKTLMPYSSVTLP